MHVQLRCDGFSLVWRFTIDSDCLYSKRVVSLVANCAVKRHVTELGLLLSRQRARM